MPFSRELLFFFSALGAFNGLLVALYFLLIAKPKHTSNYFLGLLLLTLSIRTGKSVFLYFNPHLAGVFLQVGMSACLFIGPSLYFYLRSVKQPEKSISDWKYHFIPLLAIILFIDVRYPWYSYLEEWRVFFRGIYLIWLAYLLFSGWVIMAQLKKLLTRPADFSGMEVWIVSVYLGNVLVWVAYNTVSYTSYIVGALSFSFILYLLFLLLIYTRRKDPSFLSRQVKYANKKIEDTEAKNLHRRLDQLMKDEKLFQDANLKLADVAKKLNVLPHKLSQLINDNLDKNFALLVNEYRIEDAKRLITEDQHLKLESIGYQCGFNSQSTFYATFKKLTGTTPAKYKEDLATAGPNL
ncbi:MAG: helix-turn-helix transcriptional regulator [Bacteroidota bacterium]